MIWYVIGECGMNDGQHQDDDKCMDIRTYIGQEDKGNIGMGRKSKERTYPTLDD